MDHSPVTPGYNDDAATRHAHPGQLAHKACLIRHVLPALHAPHQIEGVVFKGLLQGVRYLKACLLPKTLLLRKGITPCGLQRKLLSRSRLGKGRTRHPSESAIQRSMRHVAY